MAVTDQHYVRQPAFLFYIRIAQAVLALVVLGLAGFAVSTLWDIAGSFGFNIFCSIYTFIVVGYLLITSTYFIHLWNMWAALVLDIFGVIFWLAGFGSMAAWAAAWGLAESAASYYGSSYGGSSGSSGSGSSSSSRGSSSGYGSSSSGYGSSSSSGYGSSSSGSSAADDAVSRIAAIGEANAMDIIKRSVPAGFHAFQKRYSSSDADKQTSAWRCVAAAAGLGGLIWVLFLITLITYSIHLHRHRKAPENANLPKSGAPVEDGVEEVEVYPAAKHEMAPMEQQQQQQQQPQQQYPQQQYYTQ